MQLVTRRPEVAALIQEPAAQARLPERVKMPSTQRDIYRELGMFTPAAASKQELGRLKRAAVR